MPWPIGALTVVLRENSEKVGIKKIRSTQIEELKEKRKVFNWIEYHSKTFPLQNKPFREESALGKKVSFSTFFQPKQKGMNFFSVAGRKVSYFTGTEQLQTLFRIYKAKLRLVHSPGRSIYVRLAQWVLLNIL